MKKEINLLETTDARIWADEFNRILTTKGLIPIDPEWMISWFANAIMTGHDHALRPYDLCVCGHGRKQHGEWSKNPPECIFGDCVCKEFIPSGKKVEPF